MPDPDESRTKTREARDERDPRDEDTQPIPRTGTEAVTGRATGPDEADAGADTTTWSGEQAPPILVEEDATVSGSAPADEEATVLSPAPADEGATVLSPAPADEEATVLSPAPADGDATLLSRSSAVEESTAAMGATAASIDPGPVAPTAPLHPLLLERIEPSLGRGERIRLDASRRQVRLGRAEHNDIRLYTASASREHAEITADEAGDWVLIPAEGRAIVVDGAKTTTRVVLEVGMNLTMGGDHLRCVTEGLDRSGMSAQTAADGFDEAGRGWAERLAGVPRFWWGVAAIGLLGLALIAIAAL